MCIKSLKQKFLSILFLLLAVVLFTLDINNYVAFFIILMALFIGIFIICDLVKNGNGRLSGDLSKMTEYLSNNAFRILLIVLVLLFLILVSFHNIFSWQKIIVEPQEFKEKIPAGDSLIREIAIKNSGISDIIISIKPKSIEDLISIVENNLSINSEESKNINIFINIPLHTLLGEHRGSIEIIYENNTIKKIPILLVVQPQAQFQATIDAPDKINKTDYFKVKINIKNIGESPLHGIRIKLNTSGLNLTEIEKKRLLVCYLKILSFLQIGGLKQTKQDGKPFHLI